MLKGGKTQTKTLHFFSVKPALLLLMHKTYYKSDQILKK